MKKYVYILVLHKSQYGYTFTSIKGVYSSKKKAELAEERDHPLTNYQIRVNESLIWPRWYTKIIRQEVL